MRNLVPFAQWNHILLSRREGGIYLKLHRQFGHFFCNLDCAAYQDRSSRIAHVGERASIHPEHQEVL